jgi:hypothetical protein
MVTCQCIVKLGTVSPAFQVPLLTWHLSRMVHGISGVKIGPCYGLGSDPVEVHCLGLVKLAQITSNLEP